MKTKTYTLTPHPDAPNVIAISLQMGRDFTLEESDVGRWVLRNQYGTIIARVESAEPPAGSFVDPEGMAGRLAEVSAEQARGECVRSGGHYWGSCDDGTKPPTCTRCGYNPGWTPGEPKNEASS